MVNLRMIIMINNDVIVILNGIIKEVTDLRILFLAEIERIDKLFKLLDNEMENHRRK